jgi:hypothetical protein
MALVSGLGELPQKNEIFAICNYPITKTYDRIKLSKDFWKNDFWKSFLNSSKA